MSDLCDAFGKKAGESYCDWLGRAWETGDNLWATIRWLGNAGRRNGYELDGAGPSPFAHYVAMRLDGSSHKLAEMLALGEPPMSNTDREFLEGHANGNQFESQPGLGDYYERIASRHGQTVKGKVYLSGLATFPGDPRAWVSDRHEVGKLLGERGWGAEGSVNRAVSKVGSPLRRPLAADILEERVDDIIDAIPGAEADRTAIAETTAETLTPHWAK